MATVPRKIVRTLKSISPVAETIVSVPGVAHVSASMQSNRGGPLVDEDQQINLADKKFSELNPPAHVRFNVGQTYNLGNFNSLRLDVSITMPCLPEDVITTFEEISIFAANLLREEEIRWLPAGYGK